MVYGNGIECLNWHLNWMILNWLEWKHGLELKWNVWKSNDTIVRLKKPNILNVWWKELNDKIWMHQRLVVNPSWHKWPMNQGLMYGQWDLNEEWTHGQPWVDQPRASKNQMKWSWMGQVEFVMPWEWSLDQGCLQEIDHHLMTWNGFNPSSENL